MCRDCRAGRPMRRQGQTQMAGNEGVGQPSAPTRFATSRVSAVSEIVAMSEYPARGFRRALPTKSAPQRFHAVQQAVFCGMQASMAWRGVIDSEHFDPAKARKDPARQVVESCRGEETATQRCFGLSWAPSSALLSTVPAPSANRPESSRKLRRSAAGYSGGDKGSRALA